MYIVKSIEKINYSSYTDIIQCQMCSQKYPVITHYEKFADQYDNDNDNNNNIDNGNGNGNGNDNDNDIYNISKFWEKIIAVYCSFK